MGDNEKNFREKLRCENNDGTVPDGIQEFEEACKTLGLDLGIVYKGVENTTINGKKVGSIVFNNNTKYLDNKDPAIIDRDGDM